MQLRSIALLALFLLFGSVVPGRATIRDEVAKDFQPLSGYIIMPMGNQYLIDQDASKGVATGDLFAVVKKGKQIIHPVTKEVVGTLDEVKGMLEVTRVKTGYSYARPLGNAEELKAGDVIRRYENIPAVFWDYTGKGRGLFAQVKDALPNLEWKEYAAAQAERPATPGPLAKGTPCLLFVLNENGLEVHDADFRVIHAYPAVNSAPAAGTLLPSPTTPPATATLPPGPASTPARVQSGAVKWEEHPAVGGQGQQGYKAVYPGFDTLGALPDGTVMAEFAKSGERLLLATTNGASLHVFAVDADKLKHLAHGEPSRPGQVLALHWWQPKPGGPLYLVATSAVEVNQAVTVGTPHTVSSEIFLFRENRLTPLGGPLSYLLGSFDQDGDGINETLLGQNFDRDIFFGSRVLEFRLVDGKIDSGRCSLSLPRTFPVQGSLLADVTGTGKPEAIFVRRRVLSVYDGAQRLYESPQEMGGSLSAMTFTRNPGAVDQLRATEPFEVPPVAADLDGDGRPEVIAPAAEGSFLRAPGIGPNVNKAWLSVLHYSNDGFVRGRLGDDLETPIAGLAVYGKRVLLVSTQSGSLLSPKGKSYLLAIPLGK